MNCRWLVCVEISVAGKIDHGEFARHVAMTWIEFVDLSSAAIKGLDYQDEGCGINNQTLARRCSQVDKDDLDRGGVRRRW